MGSAGSGVVINLSLIVGLTSRPERAHGPVWPGALVPALLDRRLRGREPLELPTQPPVDVPQRKARALAVRVTCHSSPWASLGQLLALLVLTLPMSPSWTAGPGSVRAARTVTSTEWRTRLYRAQLITIAVVTPLSFVLNKIWTFSAVRPSRARRTNASRLAVDATFTGSGHPALTDATPLLPGSAMLTHIDHGRPSLSSGPSYARTRRLVAATTLALILVTSGCARSSPQGQTPAGLPATHSPGPNYGWTPSRR